MINPENIWFRIEDSFGECYTEIRGGIDLRIMKLIPNNVIENSTLDVVEMEKGRLVDQLLYEIYGDIVYKLYVMRELLDAKHEDMRNTVILMINDLIKEFSHENNGDSRHTSETGCAD